MNIRRTILVVTLGAISALLAGSLRPVFAQLRYDEIQQRSIHNIFQKEEQVLDQLIKYRIRELEFDIHVVNGPCRRSTICRSESAPDWDIYHAIPDERTTVCTLGQALVLLKAFHDAVPAHEVITVHLEFKDPHCPLPGPIFRCHPPYALDQLIFDVLGRANVFTPGDLLATKPGATTLHEAVREGWPTVDSLRGKFIFVIHGDDKDLASYMWLRHLATAAFIMFNWGNPTPEQLVTLPNIVFQGEINPPDHAKEIKDKLPYLILRSKQRDNEQEFQQFQGAGANLLLTDAVSHYFDPWARTHNDNLYPFGRAGEVGTAAYTHPSVATRKEIGLLFELATHSGDLANDSLSFATTLGPPFTPDRWEAAIATTSNDRVDNWGKGVLMARETMDQGSSYFAVGRAADEYGVFLQYRKPGKTERIDRGDWNGFEDENVHFVRLEITDGPLGETSFQAYASVDGVNFVSFGPKVNMRGTFGYRGLAASSNWSTDKGADKESFFFQAVKRNGAAVKGSHLPNVGGIPAQGTRTRLRVYGDTPQLILAPATDTKRVGKPATLTAQLINCIDPNVTVTFTVTGVNAQTGTGTLACGGTGTFTYTGNSAGNDTVVATATTTLPPDRLTSSSATILWEKSPTTLTYSGPTLIANGQPVTLSGVLKDDANAPVVGRTVNFTLGTGASAQVCSGNTNPAGTASCNINMVAQPLGPGTVKADFVGDAAYLPSSDSKATLLFAFAARGSFVVGDRSATGAVTFWGARWASVNALSGGPAPNSFRGFANTLSSTPPPCGGSWSTPPGSSPPPAPLPEFMAVLVASSVDRSGSTISGNITSIVIVKTDPGYEPDPAHPGTGTVVAMLCQ